MTILGIIPARYKSSRFPGKPLVDIKGETMVQRVYNQACKAKSLSKVIVATDDERIFNHVNSFGGNVIMTSSEHKNGTERCAEVAENEKNSDFVINIQGDEPFINPKQIDQLADFISRTEFDIATLCKKIDSNEILFNPNVVKVVFQQQRALYFSRSVIPYCRQDDKLKWILHHDYYKHIGMYAYKSSCLSGIASLQPTPLEKSESLEQLRWLESGFSIGITPTKLESISIDTPQDLDRALAYYF